jgi:hypothetical protein
MTTTARISRHWLTPLTAVALLALACGSGGGSSAVPAGTRCTDLFSFTGKVDDRGSAQLQGTAAALEAGDIFFSPTCVTGASGTVKLTVKNTGRLLHNISVPDQGIDVDVPAGQTVTVDVKVAGKAVGCFCKYHKDAGQQCALIPGKV